MGGRLQSGVEKDSFMDSVRSVVKLKLRGTDTTMEAHWSVNTRNTISCCLFLRHLFNSLPCLILLVGTAGCRDFSECLGLVGHGWVGFGEWAG